MNRRPPCPWRQRGLTLIGMMVGLLISLLSLVSLLAVYKMAIGVSTNAVGARQRDGQISAALLAAQIELQQAGYGIVRSAGAADLETLVKTRAPETGASQVVWRYRPDLATDTCAGLLLDTAGSDAGLYWLPQKACANAADATWTPSERQPLASSATLFVPQDRDGNQLAEAGAAALAGAQFQLDGTCSLPFAQQAFDDDDAYPLAQRLVLRGGDGTALFTACLSNLATGTHVPVGGGSP